MKLSEAKQIADSLVGIMRPCCIEIQVAGSVRRGKSECRDIEVVAVPRYEQRLNSELLFGDSVQVNLLHERISNDSHIRWIKPGVTEIIDWSIKPDGKYWRGLVTANDSLCERENCGGPQSHHTTSVCSGRNFQGIKLDLFLTTAESFGLILLIRTGPASWSKELVTNQHKGGLLPDHMRVSEGSLWHGSTRLDTPTEQSVFDAIGIPFIEPALRGLRPAKLGLSVLSLRES